MRKSLLLEYHLIGVSKKVDIDINFRGIDSISRKASLN